jgi:plastocyanin
MATRSKPLIDSNPALVLGVIVFLVFLVGGGAAMYALAPLVDSDTAATEAVADDGGSTTPGGPVNVTLVARNLAFDKRTITASPGVDVTVTLDNQDAGVLHNVSFYTNRSASTKIFVGELKAGVTQSVEKFKSPGSAGNYFFRCDAHPDQMTGTFVVK